MQRNSQSHSDARLKLVNATRKCLCYYFYFLDRDFGLMHVRIQSWFPLVIQLCLNGHEWLARKLDTIMKTHDPAVPAWEPLSFRLTKPNSLRQLFLFGGLGFVLMVVVFVISVISVFVMFAGLFQFFHFGQRRFGICFGFSGAAFATQKDGLTVQI